MRQLTMLLLGISLGACTVRLSGSIPDKATFDVHIGQEGMNVRHDGAKPDVANSTGAGSQ